MPESLSSLSCGSRSVVNLTTNSSINIYQVRKNQPLWLYLKCWKLLKLLDLWNSWKYSLKLLENISIYQESFEELVECSGNSKSNQQIYDPFSGHEAFRVFSSSCRKSKSSLKFLPNSFASHLKHLIKPSKFTPVSHQSNRVLCIDPPFEWTSSPPILWKNLKSTWFTQSGSGSSTGIFGIFWEEWHACVWEQWKQLRYGESVLEIFVGFWFW